jgi:MFS family permease
MEDVRRILKYGLPLNVLNRDLKLIFMTNLIGSFGDGLFAYLLPVYMSNNLNASSEQIGILYAVMSLLAAVTLFGAGMIADKYDRKKIMIAGWLAWTPAPLIFAFAGDWIHIIPGMVMWGFWLGGPTTAAYILTSADQNKLTLTFTTLSAAWSIGYIFSPALGGYLAGTIGMRFVFFMSFGLYAAACAMLFFIRSQHAKLDTEQVSEKQYSFFRLLKTRRLLKLTIFFAAVIFFLNMFRPFAPKLLSDVYQYGNFEIGLLGSVSFSSSAILGILLGRAADNKGRSYALATSLIFCWVSTTLLVLSGNFVMLLVTFFLVGGSYLTWSLLGATVGPLAPESCRARWVAVPQTVSMFSSIVAPYVGGFLYGVWPYYPFIIAIVATVLLTFLTSSKLLRE